MLARAFAILAAFFLVGAIGVASLMPADTSLAQALYAIDRSLPFELRNLFQAGWGRAVWSGAVEPLMIRPSWLVPAALGMICVGVAATASSAPPARKRRT